jgi:HEPN domain-containing protein
MLGPIGSLKKLLLALTSFAILALPFATQSSANDDEFQKPPNSNHHPPSDKPTPPKRNRDDCADAFRRLANDKVSGRSSPQSDPAPESSFFIAGTSAERTEILSGLTAALEASRFHYPSVEPLVAHNIGARPLPKVLENAPAQLRALKEQSEKNQGPRNQREALGWLEKSIEEDLSSTEVLIAAGKYGTGCYHAQQTAEKALKAVLIHFQVADPKAIKKHGHDLVSVLKALQKDVADPEVASWVSLSEAVSALTPLATKYRYPDPNVKPPSKDEAQNALQLAQIVVNLALSAMTPPTEP